MGNHTAPNYQLHSFFLIYIYTFLKLFTCFTFIPHFKKRVCCTLLNFCGSTKNKIIPSLLKTCSLIPVHTVSGKSME
jgi:hypothetical protein